MPKPSALLAILALILALVLSPLAQAQSSGSTSGAIVGTVKGSQMSTIDGVTISARQVETNITRTTQTDSNGNYRLVQLPPAKYEIKAEADGFQSKLTQLYITIGTTALVDFNLSPGGAS